MLKRFEWKWRSSIEGRRSSSYSGLSPMASRVGSVADEHVQVGMVGSVRRRHSKHGPMERSSSNGEAVDMLMEE